MAPAWKYYDSKAARDAHARLKEGEGQKVVLGHSMFGFKEGGGKKWRMRLADHRGNPSKAFGGDVRQQLLSAVTQYDMKEQEKAAKRGPRGYYNMYALPQYLGRVSDVVKDIEAGAPVRKALTNAFTGRLLDVTLKAVGEPRSTKEEQRGGPITYRSARENPQPAADDMYAAFHGEPSDETIEIAGEEHYHSHLAALGELVELKVKLVNGGTAVIGFETGAGEGEENPKGAKLPIYSVSITQAKNIPSPTRGFVGLGNARKEAAKVGSQFIAQVKDSQLKHVLYMAPSSSFSLHDLNALVRSGGGFRAHENPGGTRYRGVITAIPGQLLRGGKKKVVSSWIDSRKEAHDWIYAMEQPGIETHHIERGAPTDEKKNPFWPFNSFTHTMIYHVGTGEKYKKSGSYKGYTLYKKLDTDEFLVPALDKDSRFDTLKDVKAFVDSWTKHSKNPGPFREAGKLLGRGTRAARKPMNDFIGAAGKVGGYLDDELGRALNPSPSSHDSGPAYLTANEDGTQLFIVGGDQSLDLPGLGITGPQADKELVTIGQVTNVVYHAHKIFDGKREEYDYTHKLSEDSNGPLPVLIYDRINQQLKLSGGMYKIERPLVGTSPGIED